jgi:hypothetical protein
VSGGTAFGLAHPTAGCAGARGGRSCSGRSRP